MSTWRRHRAHRYSRASSIASPGGEGWTIRNHRAILRSEPYARADLGAASDLTAKSNLSEAAPVSPAPAISPQRHSAVIAPAHGDAISGNIGSGGKHVPGGVAGTIQCVLGRPSQITSRPDLHHLSALFGRREHHTPHAVMEAALAHVVKNKAEAVCARSDLFEKRRALMEAWSGYLAGTAPNGE